MKKLIITILVIVFSATLFTPQSFAGSKQRHRWEGVAIGLGAAALGGVILHNSRDRDNRSVGYNNASCYYPAPAQYRQKYVPHRPKRHKRPKRGHWEVRRTWVAPVKERVWNPSHYNERNEWVEGYWITIEQQPGYWKEDRVWISYR